MTNKSCNNIELLLSDTEKIVFQFTVPIFQFNASLHDLVRAYLSTEARIVFENGNESLLLSNNTESWYVYLNTLQYSLRKALDNKLQLHPSIQDDIGFVFNEYRAHIWEDSPTKITNFVCVGTSEYNHHWVGTEVRLWANIDMRWADRAPSLDYVLWLYNDKNGDIVFEITPVYHRVMYQKNNDSNTLYKEWIKNYKPYIKKVLSRDTITQWLDQIDKIMTFNTNKLAYLGNEEDIIFNYCSETGDQLVTFDLNDTNKIVFRFDYSKNNYFPKAASIDVIKNEETISFFGYEWRTVIDSFRSGLEKAVKQKNTTSLIHIYKDSEHHIIFEISAIKPGNTKPYPSDSNTIKDRHAYLTIPKNVALEWLMKLIVMEAILDEWREEENMRF
jgi:hypothetical protein